MKTKYAITSQTSLRFAFWALYAPSIARRYRRAGQNQCPAEIRTAWVEYVDACQRDGTISDKLADRAVL